jgi:hypothetical protein
LANIRPSGIGLRCHFLAEFHPKFAAYRRSGFSQGAKRNRFVLGVKQTVQSSAAGVHPPRHFSLGKVLLFHGGFHLSGENAFDGGRGNFLADALLAEPVIKG